MIVFGDVPFSIFFFFAFEEKKSKKTYPKAVAEKYAEKMINRCNDSYESVAVLICRPVAISTVIDYGIMLSLLI